MQVAFALLMFMTLALAREAEVMCLTCEAGEFAFTGNQNGLNPDIFELTDWESLAKLAGEPIALEDCEAWAFVTREHDPQC